MVAAKKAKYNKAQEELASTAERFRAKKRDAFETWLEGSFSSEALEGTVLYDVPVGGEIFKCRKLTQEFGVRIGGMPAGLAAYIATGQVTDPVEQKKVLESLSDAEQMRTLEMLSGMVRFVCVEPRVVIRPKHSSELAIGELGDDDLTTLATWAKGGDAAEGLENFPQE